MDVNTDTTSTINRLSFLSINILATSILTSNLLVLLVYMMSNVVIVVICVRIVIDQRVVYVTLQVNYIRISCSLFSLFFSLKFVKMCLLLDGMFVFLMNMLLLMLCYLLRKIQTPMDSTHKIRLYCSMKHYILKKCRQG